MTTMNNFYARLEELRDSKVLSPAHEEAVESAISLLKAVEELLKVYVEVQPIVGKIKR